MARKEFVSSNVKTVNRLFINGQKFNLESLNFVSE